MPTTSNLILLLVIISIILELGSSFPGFRPHSRCIMRLLSETKESENSQQKYENLKVEKGLTHIKYNKFAPTADEAVNMTDEQFRAVIMTRMLEAEKERRASGPVGNTASDNYLDNLSAPKAAVREVNTNGKKRYGLSKQNNRIISNDKTETH